LIIMAIEKADTRRLDTMSKKASLAQTLLQIALIVSPYIAMAVMALNK